MKTVEYLDAVKERHSLRSDNALANLIGVTRQSISGWRSGRSLPDPLFSVRIAEELEINPLVVIADIETEKALKGHHDQIASGWHKVIERMGGIAAAVMMGTVLSSPTPSHASQVNKTVADVYIGASKRRKRITPLLPAFFARSVGA